MEETAVLTEQLSAEEGQNLLTQSLTESLPVHQEIPLNSPTLLIDESTSRFSSAVWYEKIQEKTIILAGVGGVGSHVGLLLARVKPKSLFIYDNDLVETTNMSGQLYFAEDVGIPKVTALSKVMRYFADYSSVFAIAEKFTEECEPTDIMICGFDNMKARKIFFTKWIEHVNNKPEEERKNCLFIDGRIKC